MLLCYYVIIWLNDFFKPPQFFFLTLSSWGETPKREKKEKKIKNPKRRNYERKRKIRIFSFLLFHSFPFSFLFYFFLSLGFNLWISFPIFQFNGCVSLFRYRKSFRAKKVYFISLAKSSYLQYMYVLNWAKYIQGVP